MVPENGRKKQKQNTRNKIEKKKKKKMYKCINPCLKINLNNKTVPKRVEVFGERFIFMETCSKCSKKIYLNFFLNGLAS